MSLIYDRGDGSAPKGHALLYFVAAENEAKPYATYVICLPIAIDLVRYMPPILAPHIMGMTSREMSAFAFPPIPEEVESTQQLHALAQARDDDLLFGGTVSLSEVPTLLERVNAIVQEYSLGYLSYIQAYVAAEGEAPQEQLSGLGVDEVLYQLMSLQDRLAELARLVGKLRFAAEGAIAQEVEQVEQEVWLLSKYLPEGYTIPALVQAAKIPTPRAGELAGLYLERCYKLAEKNDPRLKEIEERIQALEGSEAHEQT